MSQMELIQVNNDLNYLPYLVQHLHSLSLIKTVNVYFFQSFIYEMNYLFVLYDMIL